MEEGKAMRGYRGGNRGKKKAYWSQDERKVLWECFSRSGGRKSGVYIRKVKERDLRVRREPSLISQLRLIEEKGELTMMEGEKIERMARVEEGNWWLRR